MSRVSLHTESAPLHSPRWDSVAVVIRTHLEVQHTREGRQRGGRAVASRAGVVELVKLRCGAVWADIECNTGYYDAVGRLDNAARPLEWRAGQDTDVVTEAVAVQYESTASKAGPSVPYTYRVFTILAHGTAV